MSRVILSFLLVVSLYSSLRAQISVTSRPGSYDSIFVGTKVYYQHSWDEPLEEIRDSFKLLTPLEAMGMFWDSMLVSDGSVWLTSSQNDDAALIIDATGWDLMDKGYADTINYPNLSPVMVSAVNDAVEWRDFGFAREWDTLKQMQSYGNVIIKQSNSGQMDLIYGDFGMVRPDLCFEGFGSLRPVITFIDSNRQKHTWYLFGDPEDPALDSTVKDSAFDHLPEYGRRISLHFAKTASVQKKKSPVSRVYPNPASEVIYLSEINPNGSAYRIYGTDGRLLQAGNATGKSISVSFLPQGCYILQWELNQQIFVSRFLITQN